jgi:hypothetical protein
MRNLLLHAEAYQGCPCEGYEEAHYHAKAAVKPKKDIDKVHIRQEARCEEDLDSESPS